MAGSYFEENDEFFAELGREPGVVDLCQRAADEVAARARASAPVDTADYRDGIVVEKREAAYRDMFRVVATDEKSMGVESRTGNLARALNGVRVY
ncbi:HK97 gp10 family phage protein [Microbacterium sp. MMO-56]|uniref:HK97 gp10 family phage protein n=1 Tax=Microbacterium sp. MMO-56 TaxID=3081281 RepID=UPI0030187A24